MSRKKDPVIILANSSWYIFHYRSFLIKTLKKKYSKVIAICPNDAYSPQLEKFCSLIRWTTQRENEKNIFLTFFSFLKLFLIIQKNKPLLIHSHTLKINLFASFISSILNIPCIISFAGMGRLSNGTKRSFFLLKIIIYLINFFSSFNFSIKKFNSYKDKRVIFIFQNEKDKELYERLIPSSKTRNFLIRGSGYPADYSDSLLKSFAQKNWSNPKKNLISNKPTVIYCARLLKSKGVNLFLEMSNYLTNYNFEVFGEIDTNNKDSLTLLEYENINKLYPKVKMHGKVDKPLLKVKSEYPILIIPSNYGEGFPRAFLEASLLNIPVIVSESVSKIIALNNMVYVSKGDDLDSYAECLQDILNDFKEGKLMKKLLGIKKIVKKDYSEKNLVKKTIYLYEKILKDT